MFLNQFVAGFIACIIGCLISQHCRAVDAAVVITERLIETAWNDYKQNYYQSLFESEDEETSRKNLFQKWFSMILEHNDNPFKTFTMGLNQFTDQSEDEWRKQMGLRRSLAEFFASTSLPFFPFGTSNAGRIGFNQADNLPVSIDYRNDSCMQPIKDQGICGSCWAFATVAIVEFNSCVTTGKAIALSDQQVTDCTYSASRDGCEGGWVLESLRGIARRQFGLNTESSYPYTSGQTGKSGRCNHSPSANGASVSFLFPIKRIRPGDTQTIMTILASRGIVAVGFNVVSSFMSYKSGVYTEPNCNSKIIGAHAINIVGYGTDSTTGLDYWICRNQWSTKWGDAGYVLFQRGVDLCGIESNAVGTTIGRLGQLFISPNIY